MRQPGILRRVCARPSVNDFTAALVTLYAVFPRRGNTLLRTGINYCAGLTLVDHGASNALNTVQDTQDVDLEKVTPGILIRKRISALKGGRIVHQDCDIAETPESSAGQSINFRRGGNIRPHAKHLGRAAGGKAR